VRQFSFAVGIVVIVFLGVLFVRARSRPFYRLPGFVTEILSTQPDAPRQVTIQSVARAVLGGFDCAIYAVFGVYATFNSIVLLIYTSGPGTPIGYVSLAAGLASLGLVLYRITDVWNVLRRGDALVVEITQSEIGRGRPYGTPWGDIATPRAAEGDYEEVRSRAPGHFYMQQRWALELTAGMRMWVLRSNGRDMIFAPVSTS